jgi:hypothetical protein
VNGQDDRRDPGSVLWKKTSRSWTALDRSCHWTTRSITALAGIWGKNRATSSWFASGNADCSVEVRPMSDATLKRGNLQIPKARASPMPLVGVSPGCLGEGRDVRQSQRTPSSRASTVRSVKSRTGGTTEMADKRLRYHPRRPGSGPK